ncbi:uncharacterized protein LOC110117911 [Ceratitis capitata]|uniref:uncharacterized protein LOC110117911 n=1 Tax=Ceratitis capitata TaxID=7213 RepID=UPI000A118500|nr:uncharacterized protein LOC110117911 [Ceratitis capitata]
MELTCTLAIPANSNDSNNADLTDKTETSNDDDQTQLDTVALDKFKLNFKDDYFEPANRTQAFSTDEEELCHSTTKLIYPMSAQSKDGEFVTVVQNGEHKQGFRVEVCENESGSCKFADIFPLGYTATCVQRYIFRTAVVVVNGELKEELLKLPSTCKCVLKLNRL